MAKILLELNEVDKHFGGVQAVKNLSFAIHESEIVGLIGPNGSGKSTTVNLISGALDVSSGAVNFDGHTLSGLSTSQRVPLGLARTFQTTTLFAEFTVCEQVMVACHCRYQSGPWQSVFRTKAGQKEESSEQTKAMEIIEFVGLAAVANVKASSISSAQQRLLMIATALATQPRLLLLDEPAAGMVASERKELAKLIMSIRDSGVAVLVIEHHMGLIMEVCEQIVVLNFGQRIAQGIPSEIRNHKTVIDAYLGGTH